jgi:hypothetical protein
MRRHLGSETFGTAEISADEYLLMAKVITKNGGSVHQAALEIKMMDDVLCMMKMKIIIVSHQYTKSGKLRKDADLQSMIDRRINLLIDDLRLLDSEPMGQDTSHSNQPPPTP